MKSRQEVRSPLLVKDLIKVRISLRPRWWLPVEEGEDMNTLPVCQAGVNTQSVMSRDLRDIPGVPKWDGIDVGFSTG
jgi:hypothetical protein